MKFEDLTNEQQEKAKACKTYEERLAFIEECGIELEDDMLDDVSGGGQPCWDKTPHKTNKHECPKRNRGKNHEWEKTGREKSFLYFWTDREYRCIYCGKTEWR